MSPFDLVAVGLMSQAEAEEAEALESGQAVTT